ncbi:MAG: TaqI-like C-terminal specificity domain-containing protein [bacterium]|nr:TaqI-like C-terminal specificity domain-containing protein [bacterium]
MINPIFTNKYNEEAFAEFIQGIIPRLSLDKKRSEVRTGFKSIQQIAEAGENKLDLVVFVAKLDSSLHARVEITKNTYAVLKSHARSNALVAYISDDSLEWRLSLVTTKVTRTKDGIKESVSNPRRFSYVLGPNAKVATPSKMLQGIIDSIIDLENKFSLAVVSKEFFTQIATQYSKLVGGTRGEGRKAVVFERTLKLGSIDDAVNANFAIRLIGRLVFCWFLKQKKGHLNNPLIPSEILSVSAVKTTGDYYHSVCVPLFFEVLNKPQPSRPTFFALAEFFNKVPFLNGGLFQDHTEDNHKFNKATGMSDRRGVVNIPDIWFSELFQIFEEYNFTIDENTSIDTELSIDPEMLGRIFENLLAEVNPETGASARKSTGSFYTPREIVDFMVEESLITHLKTKTNISEEKLRALSSYNLDDDASYPINPHERRILAEAIHITTILDPACGSGAFPIGVLQRLVHMLEVLDPECSMYINKFPPEARRLLQKHDPRYVRKLGVIRECIHGVDIQPIAIDISRLRCFLTLIVDQQVDDNADNRGIEPLPNLDFKFVCANTLISPPVHEGPLFGDEFAIALGELVDEYFTPVDQNHKLVTAGKLKDLIHEKTKRELENILKSYSYVKDEKYKKALAQKNEKSDSERLRINDLWGSYENIFQNKPVGFFDTRYFSPAVFRSGGFDIVIGNPPYLRERGNKLRFEEVNLSEFGKKYHQGKMDFWFYFLHKAIDLVKDKGIITFITSRYWLNSYGAKKLIKRVSTKLSFVSFVDIGKLKVFDSVAGQHMVAVYKKTKDVDKFMYKKLVNDISDIGEKRDTQNLKIKLLSNSSVFINDEIILEDDHKLNDVFILGSICDISVGVQESPDKISNKQIKNSKRKDVQVDDGVFVLSQSELDTINPNKTERSAIKKYLDPNDIYRYGMAWRQKYLIYTDNVVKEKIRTDIKYINIKKHLDKYSGFITSSNKPYGLHRPREIKYFVTPKIIFKGMFVKNEFTYDDQNYFTGFSFSMIIEKNPEYGLKYILAVLNSKFALEWFYRNGKKRGAGVDIGVIKLRQFPIKKALECQQKQFIEIVDKILAITKSGGYLENPAKKEEVTEYEKQIDQLVYKLYDLTPEETTIIEKSMR